MRALVTGAGGFVGRHLIAALRASGWTVESFRGDIRYPGAVRRFRGNAVFHLAAQANPADSRKIPTKTFEVNALGTQRLLDALDGFGGRVVVVSTCDVYRLDPRPRRESDPLAPRNPYGWTKLMVEAIARAHERLDVIVVRPFNHTGPGQSPLYVCPSFAHQVATQDVVRVGQLDSVRDFMDVRDVVKAYMLLAEKGRRGETYNIASGRGRKIGEILDALIGLSGRRVKVVVDHARVRPADALVGDSSKLRAATGWRPEIPFERTLEDLVTASTT